MIVAFEQKEHTTVTPETLIFHKIAITNTPFQDFLPQSLSVVSVQLMISAVHYYIVPVPAVQRFQSEAPYHWYHTVSLSWLAGILTHPQWP